MACRPTTLFFLLVLLGQCPTVSSARLKILFTYQSWHIDAPSEWFTIFTVCLAPLLTHIVFGLAETVVLSEDGPPWTEKITRFNPVSVIWRYYAITYRRLRATSWDAADMAACNAVFWDGKSWHGSEHMMIRSREYLTNPPRESHVPLVSGSSFSTAILAFQGAQAVLYIVENAFPASFGGTFADGIPLLFMPIGLLGLLRLPAAYWVTNDFRYELKESQRPYVDLSHLTDSELALRHRLGDTRSWKCTLYRIWWLGSLSTLAGFVIYDALEALVLFDQTMSLYCFLYLLMYLLLVVGAAIIHIAYVLRQDHGSTVIPCIQSTWYKLYTCILVVAAVATIIVGSLETVLLPDGSYTTYPL